MEHRILNNNEQAVDNIESKKVCILISTGHSDFDRVNISHEEH